MSDDGLRQQWRAWARAQGTPEDQLEAAVDAQLRRGMARADVVLEELDGLTPSGAVSPDALAAVRGAFATRREALAGALRPAAADVPATPPPPAPTLREFFGEHSILLLSYVGAFLLIVAAVLYEVYAIGQLSGGLRFAGVLGLDLVFAAAGWACLRSRRMRLVGDAYVAIFALLAPLVGVAAYVFLGLREHGIGIPLAVCLTGSALTVLYAALSLRLRSHAYGYLALVALPVAWLGGVAAAGSGAWHGPAAAPLVAAYVLIALAARRVPALGERFSRRAALFVHAGAALAVAACLTSSPPPSWASAVTLGVIGAGYLLHRAILLAAFATSLAVLAANAALGLGFGQAAAELLVLAVAYGAAAEVVRDGLRRDGFRAGMAVQALVPAAFLQLPPAGAAAALTASTALLAATAWRTRAAAWLLLAGGAFSVDWYWLGRAVLPPQPPSAGALALLLSPLPAVLAVCGMALRATLGRSWAWPLYGVAAAAALAVLGLSGTDVGLAGRALLAYAAVAYAAAALERSPLAIGLALVGGGTGLALALAAGGTAPIAVQLALAAFAAAVYAAGRLWWRGVPAVIEAHVGLGLAGSGAVAAAGFPLTTQPDAVLAALTALAFAGLLAVEARLRPMALLGNAAAVAGSLAVCQVARFLGATNPQWYVAAPGVALVATGVTAPGSRSLMIAATTVGAALLLGTTAVQAFADAGWAYTAWLVTEAVIAVLVGIATRSRALVVAGATAVGVGGLRALFVLVEQGLLFAAFGAAAVFLLGLGAALAALRDRVRGPLGTAWREWN